jgi:hypothetical protein
VQAWPTIHLLDHKGVIRYKNVDLKAMDKLITGLLKEIRTEIAEKPSRIRTADKTTIADNSGKSSADDNSRAGQLLKFAKILASDGKVAKARERLDEILKRYPESDAAREAKELLKKPTK